MPVCAIAVRKLEVGSQIRGNFAILSYQKAEDVNFFRVFLKISFKRGIRVKPQRCSTNMNIKVHSRIRNSRIYSVRGQTVWSCHPQFGEDFKNLQKQFLPKSILMFCKFETMHSSWSMFGASQIGFRYWTLRVSELQPHCLLLIGTVDWGFIYR